MSRLALPGLTLGLLAGCAAPTAAPSLAPRASEAIDPRVPVANPVIAGPVDPALSRRLAELLNQAQQGDAAFREAIARAEQLAGAADAPQSEGWVAAQQALSAAQAAREQTTRALGDVDALAAGAIAARGGLAPGDLAAIQSAAAQVAAIDRSQAQRIGALQARLGV